MTSYQLTWLWGQIESYRSRTGEGIMGTKDGQKEIEAKLREQLAMAQSQCNRAFVDACSEVIIWIPPLRNETEKLIEAQTDRIDDNHTVCSILLAYGDAEFNLPQWLIDRVTTLLDDQSVLATEKLEDFAAVFPSARSLALVAYRKRIAGLDIKALLNIGEFEDDDFSGAWHEELLKPSRKAEIAGLLVELGKTAG